MTNARRRFIIRTNLQERLVLKCAFPWPSDVAGHLASIDKGTRGSAGRKCPHTASKPLRIHKVFSAAFSLFCEHFCSGRTASHRTALDFRGIFVLLNAGGLSPAKDKRAKSTEKTYLSDVCALVNRRFPLRIQNIPSPMEAGCCFFIRVWRSRDRRRGNIPW